MKVLLIDNYDSFTYNLYQYMGEVLEQGSPHNTPTSTLQRAGSFSLTVLRNDEKSFSEVEALAFDRIVISPGPGSPADKHYFGISSEVISILGKKIPVLGVCLGMQGVAHAFGGAIIRANLPMHGKTSIIDHDGRGVFHNLPQKIEVMRYHSLVVDPETLPTTIEISATYGEKGSAEYTIMGIRHKTFPIEGIQFHPESFATEGGKIMLANFLYREKYHV